MAQTTSFGPYRWFDYEWQPRLDIAAKMLRSIQDRWLTSDSPFPVEQTISIILYVFDFDLPPAERQNIDEWLVIVTTPIEACAHCLPRIPSAEHERVVDALSTVILNAVSSWESDTAAPLCDDVVRECLDYLAANRFVTINK